MVKKQSQNTCSFTDGIMEVMTKLKLVETMRVNIAIQNVCEVRVSIVK